MPDQQQNISHGPVVIITGHSRGIGRALFQKLTPGDQVAGLAGISRTSTEFSVSPQVMSLCGDVSSQSNVLAMVEQVVARFGKLTVLVNNAAICPVAAITERDNRPWIETVSVNLVGAYFCVRAALPAIMASGGGRIINVLSDASVRSAPGLSAYGASKAGLAALTRTLANELQDSGVLIYGYIPGNVRTEMNPGGRRRPAAVAEELARLIFEVDEPNGTIFLPGDNDIPLHCEPAFAAAEEVA